MIINGTNIFMGAYEERRQQNNPINRDMLIISEDKQAEIKAKIEEAIKEIGWDKKHSAGATVSISQEDRDFLCSEEGFQKMKQDVADLYLKNAERQKTIAAGREEKDIFWTNTGNQWLLFSEYLYNNDFYSDISDEEVKEMENTLARITAGMDHLSRSQYLTGMDFSDYYGQGSKYFMTKSECLMELEASTAALAHFADKYLAGDKRSSFNSFIEQYHSHNLQIIDEYQNPMESFNKMVYSIHANKYPGADVLEKIPKDGVVDEYNYTIMLGGISHNAMQQERFRSELRVLFAALGQEDMDSDKVWEQVKKQYIDYATDKSDDLGFADYVWKESESVLQRMQQYWNILLN
ncbi:MAG: hypothetical protein J6C63_04220 [Lachnospiraceae bacterium]|nr:hypothetical protein [Lachnospiraceae bacterium]